MTHYWLFTLHEMRWFHEIYSHFVSYMYKGHRVFEWW